MSFDKFVTYAELWSPGFLWRSRGASSEEIQLLTELVGFPLPAVHAQFLTRMGHGDGGARIASEGSTDITDIIDQYRPDEEDLIRLSEPDFVPQDRILLEAGLVAMDLSLKLRPNADPYVVFSGITSEILCAESFVGYLGQRAFCSLRQVPSRYRLSYSSSYLEVGSRCVIADVGLLCLRLGFVAEWFSDSVSFCGERGDVAVFANQLQDQGMAVVVASNDAQRAQTVGDALEREFNLRRFG